MHDPMVMMTLGQLGPSSSPANDAPTTPPPAAVSSQTGTSTQAPGSPAPTAEKSSPGSSLLQFLPIVLMFVALYFFLFRGQRKDEKKRKSMIEEMKKGDKVMTIGGLVARVVSIDGDEVVLKIDESANVKATYKKTAIQQVLGGDEKTK